VIEELRMWFLAHPTTTNIIKYLAWILLVWLIVGWLGRIIRKKLPDNRVKYKSQKGVEIIGYFFVVLITISYFAGNIKDFGLAIGLLTAGITITLKN